MKNISKIGANSDKYESMTKYPSFYATLLLSMSVFFNPCEARTTAHTHHPEALLQAMHGKSDEGRQIVNHFCSTCHDSHPLIHLGAPRIGIYDDWAPRLTQGMKQLFQHTSEGYRAMPARGGCLECDDDQLRKAILAMLPSKKNDKNNSKHK